jgi:hypothetical protein
LLLAAGDLCRFNLLLPSLVECNAFLGRHDDRRWGGGGIGWSLFYGNI